MPKPIFMTEEMITESFEDLRKSFEEAFAKAKAAATAGTKLADGKFEFKYPGINYTWDGDKSRATVTFTAEAWARMLEYVLTTDKEIGWHGTVERGESAHTFIIRSVELFPQTVTGSTVDADLKKYPLWAMAKPNEELQKMRFHGHSHVNMGVTPSGVDMTYRKNMIGQYKDGFYIFLIINKRLEISGQVYDFDDNILFDTADIDVTVEGGLREAVKEEKKTFITEYKYPSYGSQYGPQYGPGYRDYRQPQTGSTWSKHDSKPKSESKSDSKKKEETPAAIEDGDGYYGKHTHDPYGDAWYDAEEDMWHYIDC